MKLTSPFWPSGTNPRTGAWMMLDGREVGLGPLLRRLQLKNSRWDWRVQRGEDGRFQLLPPKLPAAGSTSSAAAASSSGPMRGGSNGRMLTPANIKRYRVVHAPRVAIRAGAGTSDAIIGAAHIGAEVDSCGTSCENERLRRDAHFRIRCTQQLNICQDRLGKVLNTRRRWRFCAGREGNWLRLTAASWIRLTGRQVDSR